MEMTTTVGPALTLGVPGVTLNDLLDITVGGGGGSGGTTPPLIGIGIGGGGSTPPTTTPPVIGVGVGVGGGSTPTTVTPPVIGVGIGVGGGGSTSPTSGGAPAGGVGLGLGNLLINVGVGSGASGGSGSGGGLTIGVGVGGGAGGGGLTIGVGGGTGTGTDIGVGIGGPGGSGGTGAGGGAGTGSGTGGLPDPHTAFVNIFRLESAAQIPSNIDAQLNTLDSQIASGQITAKQAVLAIVDAAAAFTAVAETSYQFFTGLTPSAQGLTYLVHSAGNPTDLSDAYYDPFNMENRYINFASNLGLHSDAAPEFAQVYGPMSFEGAVATAYERIIGASNAAAAGVDAQAAIADIAGRRPYFEAVAHERFAGDDFGLSTKLAAVAYIMQEAVRAEVGSYGQATQNFLFDLADGQAQFNVDLVGVYGPGTPLDVA